MLLLVNSMQIVRMLNFMFYLSKMQSYIQSFLLELSSCCSLEQYQHSLSRDKERDAVNTQPEKWSLHKSANWLFALPIFCISLNFWFIFAKVLLVTNTCCKTFFRLLCFRKSDWNFQFNGFVVALLLWAHLRRTNQQLIAVGWNQKPVRACMWNQLKMLHQALPHSV